MATSVRDLLIRLDSQAENLGTTASFPPSPVALEHGWRQMARAARRLVEVSPQHAPGAPTRRLQLILQSIPDPGPARPAGLPATILDLAVTLGTIGDLLTLRPILSEDTQQTGGQAISDSLQAALATAASWTLHLKPDGPPQSLEPQLRRFAGHLTGPLPAPPLATAAWRLAGPNDPGLDGAVARWAEAARRAIEDPRTASQLGLQLAAGGIALICHSASASAAADAWERAAAWPAHLRLGGRSTGLRDASQDLRETIQNTLGHHVGGRPTEEMLTGDLAEHQTEIAHSALQAACHVGLAAAETLRELSYGPSRVWTQTEQVLRYLPSTQQRLAAAGMDWLPDPAGVHSAKPLHQIAVKAHDALTRAAQHYLATNVPRSALVVSADEQPWEIVTASIGHRRQDEEIHANPPAHDRPVSQ